MFGYVRRGMKLAKMINYKKKMLIFDPYILISQSLYQTRFKIRGEATRDGEWCRVPVAMLQFAQSSKVNTSMHIIRVTYLAERSTRYCPCGPETYTKKASRRFLPRENLRAVNYTAVKGDNTTCDISVRWCFLLLAIVQWSFINEALMKRGPRKNTNRAIFKFSNRVICIRYKRSTLTHQRTRKLHRSFIT